MKSRKNTIKRSGGGNRVPLMDYANVSTSGGPIFNVMSAEVDPLYLTVSSKIDDRLNADHIFNVGFSTRKGKELKEQVDFLGGSKRRSRKSRKTKKTKKGRGSHEGGKKKCPKHCRRKTRRTRKGLKHSKN